MEYKANQFCIHYGWQYYVILLQFEPLISFYDKNVITKKSKPIRAQGINLNNYHSM